MTQQEMRDQLAHERYLEFSFEGHRFDDIHRWGWLNDPAKLADLKVRDPEFVNFVPGREFYPIPQSEIDNNPGFVQNNPLLMGPLISSGVVYVLHICAEE